MTDTELEAQLVAMLRRRASDIKAAPPFGVEADRRRPHRQLVPLAMAAAAAAVVLVVGGTVVGIRSIPHRTPAGTSPPSPTTTSPHSCGQLPAPSSWEVAIASDAISLDRARYSLMSTNGDTGEFLVLQDLPASGHSSALYQQVRLALFHGSTDADISDPVADPNELPIADPIGAINGDWVVWGLSAPQNGDTFFKIVAYDRNKHRLTPVTQLSPTERTAGLVYLGAPVLVGHLVYWLAGRWNDPGTTSLRSFDLTNGTIHDRPVPGGTNLIGYRSGVAVMVDHGRTMVNGAGTALSAPALSAAAGGLGFGIRAGVLSWTTGAGYHTNRIGSPTVSTVVTSQAVGGTGADTAPLLPLAEAGPTQVLDLRTGSVVELPDGDVVLGALGDRLIVGSGTDKTGSDELSLVPLDDLPPVRC